MKKISILLVLLLLIGLISGCIKDEENKTTDTTVQGAAEETTLPNMFEGIFGEGISIDLPPVTDIEWDGEVTTETTGYISESETEGDNEKEKPVGESEKKQETEETASPVESEKTDESNSGGENDLPGIPGGWD